MGYLNNASVSVDAILTTKGRELLAKGGNTNGLDIRYFALGDDEVNYDLWNPAHPLGSDYYGIVIENMPVLEASPIPEQNLKSKLITLPRNTPALVTVNLAPTTNTFKWNYNDGSIKTTSNARSQEVAISTSDPNYNNNMLGYTITYDPTYFTITDSSVGMLGVNFVGNQSTTSAIGDSNLLTSIVVQSNFTITQKAITAAQAAALLTTGGSPSKTSLIYIDANEIGGRATYTVNLSL